MNEPTSSAPMREPKRPTLVDFDLPVEALHLSLEARSRTS
jgi:hypothetical protein